MTALCALLGLSFPGSLLGSEMPVGEFHAQYRSADQEEQDALRLGMLRYIRGYRDAFANVYLLEGVVEGSDDHNEFIACVNRVSALLFDQLLVADDLYVETPIGQYFWHVFRVSCGEDLLGPYPNPYDGDEGAKRPLREQEST